MNMKRINCLSNASDLLDIAARSYGVTKTDLLNALAHYVTSINERPGSWEAESKFDIANYIGPNAFADKWDASTLLEYRRKRNEWLQSRR